MPSDQALSKKGWEGEEDLRLLELHAAYGPNWTHIARGMGSKSAKQCRERYTQQLRPGLNRSPISEEEGRRIMEMVQESGQRWAQIARNLGTNRSDNQVKNWWNGAKRKETSKRQDAAQSQNQNQQYRHDYPPSPGLAALPERRGILPPIPLELPLRKDSATAAFEAQPHSSCRSYDVERPPSLVSDNGSSWSSSQPSSASSSPTTFSQPSLVPLHPSSQHHPDGYSGVFHHRMEGFEPTRWTSTGFPPSACSPEPSVGCPSPAPTSPARGAPSSATTTHSHDYNLALPPLLLPQTKPDSNCYRDSPNSATSKPGSSSSSFGPVRRSSEILQPPSQLSPLNRFAKTAPATPVTRASSSRWEPYATQRPSAAAHPQQHQGGEANAKGSLSFLLN
ncbi:uncharacterized protein THITE_2106830 [Thermothielavioides terrestris NRRL 8126]|uniref:Uncharacterized protein n=1 Tax=Thermothielavioides terrestris (strain ATCC 38088 / NRRL 8126) TaxID=578455 RepID=G2QRJ4_THETT|nr:uncharacterized protein THITE_2106830 [Thermothielavioides terrestris NRRL 8126]AEO62539.1 hypothetical protein THITE_2106830 [Thermothielavioides terrestris NRRL 8126]